MNRLQSEDAGQPGEVASESESGRRLPALPLVISIVCAVLILVFMRHLPVGTIVDELVLEHYRFMFDRLPGGNIVTPVIMVAWAAAAVLLLIRKPKAGGLYLAVSVAVGCLICNYAGLGFKSWYSQEEYIVREMMTIDNYLDEQGPDVSVMYIVNSVGEFKLDETTDTYMDHMEKFCYVDSSFITDLAPGTRLNVADTPIKERLWQTEYTDIDRIDYYVIENTANPESYHLDNVEPVPELPAGCYTVYRNIEPETIAIK